jgi:hypothetical protein
MGFEADISHRAIMFEAPLLALEVSGAYHLVHDPLKFLSVRLLHTNNIPLAKTPKQSHFITEKIRMQNQYSGSARGKGQWARG